MRGSSCELPLQRGERTGVQHDVVVEQQAQFVARGGEADVAREARAAVAAGVDHTHSRELRSREQRCDQLARAVVAVVVDDQDLRRRRLLRQQGLQALGQVVPAPS